LRLCAPIAVDIYLTPRCNLACSKCYASDYVRYTERLSTSEFRLLLGELREARVFCVVFLGGEPLTASDFFAISRHSIDIGMYTSLSTNGILLTKRNVDRMKNIGIERVQVSMDGATRETVEYFKGAGTYEPTLDGIRRATARGLHVHVGYVLTSKNCGELEQFLDLIVSLGVQSCHFMSLMPFGKAKATFDYWELAPGAWKATIDRLAMLQRQYAGKIEIQFERKFEFEDKLLQVPRSKISELDLFTMSCEAGRYEATVMPNGDVVPCVFFADDSEWIGGNVRKQSFQEIWDNSKPFNYFRQISSGDIVGKCAKCKAAHLCRGGCRAIAYHMTGNFRGVDTRCPHDPKISPQMFRLDTA